jgi:hypothetical protein
MSRTSRQGELNFQSGRGGRALAGEETAQVEAAPAASAAQPGSVARGRRFLPLKEPGAWCSVMINDGTAPPAARPVPALTAARAGSRPVLPVRARRAFSVINTMVKRAACCRSVRPHGRAGATPPHSGHGPASRRQTPSMLLLTSPSRGFWAKCRRTLVLSCAANVTRHRSGTRSGVSCSTWLASALWSECGRAGSCHSRRTASRTELLDAENPPTTVPTAVARPLASLAGASQAALTRLPGIGHSFSERQAGGGERLTAFPPRPANPRLDAERPKPPPALVLTRTETKRTGSAAPARTPTSCPA